MSTRLPVVGGDDNNWGQILNEFLGAAHNNDGTLQSAALRQAGAVTSVNTITPQANGNVTLTAADVGAVQLGGDLVGTVAAPRVAKIQGTTIAAPSGGATHFLNATGGWTAAGGAANWANVKDYGAVGDGSTDDTAAIAAAVAAVTPADGVFDQSGTVFFPAGTYTTDTITLPQRVGLMGIGFASTIQLKPSAGQFANLIVNSQDAGASGNGAQACTIQNLRLDGNNGNQGGGSWQSGIVFTNTYSPSWPYEYHDARHLVTNVLVQYFTGDGIVIDDSVVDNANVWSIGGFGYIIASDANISNSSAGGCGLDGFVINGSSQLTNCKAWFCGSALTSGRYSGDHATALTVASPPNDWDGGSGITYSLANGYGNGFLLGPLPGSGQDPGNAATLTGCYAQDNARAGFYNTLYYVVLSGCVADSNGNCGTSDGTASGTPVGSFAGFDIAEGTYLRVDGLSWDRGANLNRQAAALHLVEWNTAGDISLTFRGVLNDGSNMPPLMSGDASAGVNLRFNGQGGFNPSLDTLTSATVADPYYATTYTYWVGGSGVGLGVPAYTGTNTTGTFLYNGMKLRFILYQDSTGHAVSFDSVFKLSGSVPTTANSVSTIEFMYDGSHWRQIGSIVTTTS